MTSATHISIDHKEWAKYLRALVGGETAVTAYYDEGNENIIPIFTGINSDGVVAATIGLMDFNQSRRPGTRICTEIIMDQRGHDPRISNILSTIAFYIMKNGWKVAPGVVFESMVEMYIPETKLPHVMFTAPFQWNNLSKVDLQERTIYPLIAIPISEAESTLASEDAGRNLESFWVSHAVDVLDWNRSGAA